MGCFENADRIDAERKFCLAFSSACDMNSPVSVLPPASLQRRLREESVDMVLWRPSPARYRTAAQDSYMEAQDAYAGLFEDRAEYSAVMHALGGILYREMRMKA